MELLFFCKKFKTNKKLRTPVTSMLLSVTVLTYLDKNMLNDENLQEKYHNYLSMDVLVLKLKLQFRKLEFKK